MSAVGEGECGHTGHELGRKRIGGEEEEERGEKDKRGNSVSIWLIIFLGGQTRLSPRN